MAVVLIFIIMSDDFSQGYLLLNAKRLSREGELVGKRRWLMTPWLCCFDLSVSKQAEHITSDLCIGQYVSYWIYFPLLVTLQSNLGDSLPELRYRVCSLSFLA